MLNGHNAQNVIRHAQKFYEFDLIMSNGINSGSVASFIESSNFAIIYLSRKNIVVYMILVMSLCLFVYNNMQHDENPGALPPLLL